MTGTYNGYTGDRFGIVAVAERPHSRSEQIVEAEKEVEDIEAELEDAIAAESDCFWTQKASRDVDDGLAWQTSRNEVRDLQKALGAAQGRLNRLR